MVSTIEHSSPVGCPSEFCTQQSEHIAFIENISRAQQDITSTWRQDQRTDEELRASSYDSPAAQSVFGYINYRAKDPSAPVLQLAVDKPTERMLFALQDTNGLLANYSHIQINVFRPNAKATESVQLLLEHDPESEPHEVWLSQQELRFYLERAGVYEHGQPSARKRLGGWATLWWTNHSAEYEVSGT